MEDKLGLIIERINLLESNIVKQFDELKVGLEKLEQKTISNGNDISRLEERHIALKENVLSNEISDNQFKKEIRGQLSNLIIKIATVAGTITGLTMLVYYLVNKG